LFLCLFKEKLSLCVVFSLLLYFSCICCELCRYRLSWNSQMVGCGMNSQFGLFQKCIRILQRWYSYSILRVQDILWLYIGRRNLFHLNHLNSVDIPIFMMALFVRTFLSQEESQQDGEWRTCVCVVGVIFLPLWL
jgi:hypothetical protein